MIQTLRMARLDFLTIRKYLGFRQLGLFLLLAFALCFMNGNPSFIIGTLMMYGLFYTAYPFAIGEKTKTDLLFASLPLQRQNLVFGRYLFAFIINLGSAAIALLFALVVSFFMQQEFVLEETLATILGCFFLFTLMESIQLPFYFKFGYTKAKLFVFLPILFIPALVFFLFRLVQESGIVGSLTDFGNQIAQNPLPSVSLALLFWVLAIALSLVASLRNYRKREF